MKKFLSLVLALIMTMSLVTVSAGAKDFTDDEKITYDEAVAVMSEVKVLDGYTDGSFKPQGGLTRGAAAKIICNLILGPTTAAELHADTAPYKDVPVDNTFAGYIAYCAKEGIISGYADGTFRPAAPLTGYAFMKMLLGALGYDSGVEGYTGANWSINVAKRAIGIGLNAGLVDDFSGIKNVTREEAALYAFNTLKATMVDYDTTITVGDVTITGSRAFDVANNAKVETIKDDNKMQFAEKYFTKLSVAPAQDAFGRPCNKWINNKDEIDTFVDYTKIVAEYTTSVTGKELYDVVGGTAYEDYDFAAYVDGEDSNLWKEISKNNKGDVTSTGNGALMQIFVDNDSKNGDVVITVINTYLAQANDDYNAKKDSVAFTVYDIDNNAKVYGEDFDIEDIEKDDFVLVTYDKVNDEIVDIMDVETIEDTEIEKFKAGKSGNLTVDGTTYKYNEMAKYDPAVLDDYTGITNNGANLKDVTYNVYIDQYGYVIGVEEVTAPNNYLFITGADSASSNLTNKTWAANAIFMDGTSKVIDVKSTSITTAAPVINKWFKYTVSNSGVYTLELVNDQHAVTANDQDKCGIAQAHSSEGQVPKIDDKHISVYGIGADARVYGNDNTVYLLADLDKVTKKVNGVDADYAVITGVDEVVTGVDNAAFTTYGWTAARNAAKATAGVASDDNTSYGTYALYKSNGYVVAAVVVGESATVSSSIAYVHSSKVSSESYSKTNGTWTWTRDVIINGEEVELVETNDTGVSALKTDADMRQYNWVRVKYFADGTVKEVESFRDAGKFVTSIQDAVVRILADEDFIVLDSNAYKQFAVDGKTLYDVNDRETGFRLAEDVKIVLTQTNQNKSTTTYEEGVNALKSILADLNEGNKGYWFDAVIEDGRATTVIIDDQNKDTSYEGPNGSDNSDEVVALSAANNSGAKGAKIELAAKVANDTTYNVDLYMVNGGAMILIDTVSVKVSAGTNYGFTAITGLAAGQQYKLVCGNQSALLNG